MPDQTAADTRRHMAAELCLGRQNRTGMGRRPSATTTAKSASAEIPHRAWAKIGILASRSHGVPSDANQSPRRPAHCSEASPDANATTL